MLHLPPLEMSPAALWVLTCAIVLLQLAGCQTTDGLTCYKCSSSKDLTTCLSQTEACSGTQTCFKQEKTGSSPGLVEQYSMGCMDTSACSRMPQSTARDLCDNAGMTCYSCCRDRSLCNAAPGPVAANQTVFAATALALLLLLLTTRPAL